MMMTMTGEFHTYFNYSVRSNYILTDDMKTVKKTHNTNKASTPLGRVHWTETHWTETHWTETYWT